MSEHNMQFMSLNDSRRQIMLIEPEVHSRAFLQKTLANDYDIIIASSDSDIVENRTSLDLVILGLSQANRGGLEVLERLSADPLLQHIPAIVMGDSRSDEIYTLNRGAMDFILKPCDIPEVIQARVRHAIEMSKNQNTIRSIERDPLTGLYTKDFFLNYCVQYDNYHREMDMDALLVNISHFHMMNERYGKAFADDVLKRIGGRLGEYMSKCGGIVCRSAADIFMIYCPHTENYHQILNHALSGMDSKVRVRMGVYPHADKTLDIERRFDRAKLASDTLRNSFTRHVAIYDDGLRKSEIYLEQLLDDFPRAIRDKEFVVYYQPKFAIQSTLPVLNSAEALVRWKHPTLGLITPGDFIPLFESNGLIRELDSYVWREVAAQMRDWKDRLEICVPVSVNVSRVDIFDNDLVEHMQALIQEFGLSPNEFLLEITESAYTRDSGQIISTVKALREAGFKIEIDDFGSGYSSLNMISTMPVDALKLDMEFMHNAFQERKNTRMLDAVIDIAYSLEVPTIAEGVETAEQMFALKAMGCDIVQGYYFSRPLPPEEYERFLIEKKNGRRYHEIAEKEDKIKAAEQFAYEALHDPLTGLYNHSAYKMLLKDADQRNIALLLADVDDYAGLLDTHGREKADKVLELVADVLKHSFRSVDFICRIEEYEFAVIMTRVNSDMRSLISDKMERIKAMLRDHQGNLPPVTLSVGVAFADRTHPKGDIFQDADSALQEFKHMKHNGCAIYGE